jgi:hypothetical protein
MVMMMDVEGGRKRVERRKQFHASHSGVSSKPRGEPRYECAWIVGFTVTQFNPL